LLARKINLEHRICLNENTGTLEERIERLDLRIQSVDVLIANDPDAEDVTGLELGRA